MPKRAVTGCPSRVRSTPKALALDGRSDMDQASTQRTASGTGTGKPPLLFVCAKRNLRRGGRRPEAADRARVLAVRPMPFRAA